MGYLPHQGVPTLTRRYPSRQWVPPYQEVLLNFTFFVHLFYFLSYIFFAGKTHDRCGIPTFLGTLGVAEWYVVFFVNFC